MLNKVYAKDLADARLIRNRLDLTEGEKGGGECVIESRKDFISSHAYFSRFFHLCISPWD